jgi:hypothetical protein
MPLGRPAAGALLTLGLLCAVPPALANHKTFATATLSMDAPSPTCVQYERRTKSRCNGSRLVRVAWSVACSGTPDVTIRYWSPRPDGTGSVALRDVAPPGGKSSGVAVVRFRAGVRVFAAVEVDCFVAGDGQTTQDHTASAVSKPTQTVFIPPRLVSVEAVRNSFCGVDVPVRLADRLLQARRRSSADYHTVFNGPSLLGVRKLSRAGRARTILRARGAGLRIRRRARSYVPGATGRIRTEAGIVWRPRRAGWLRVWAVIGGHRTNALAFKVLRGRACG